MLAERRMKETIYIYRNVNSVDNLYIFRKMLISLNHELLQFPTTLYVNPFSRIVSYNVYTTT